FMVGGWGGGEGGMVFGGVRARAALVIVFGASGGKALAQYYPPVQAYPPPQAYPPQGYYPRQGYRPPVVDDEDDDDMVYDLEGRPLPPRAVAKPQPNKAVGGRYPDGRQRGYRDLPPRDDEDYEPYYGMPGGIPPGSAGSAVGCDFAGGDAIAGADRPRSSRSGTRRSACDRIDWRRRPSQHGRIPT